MIFKAMFFLLQVQGMNGQMIDINPREITNIQEPSDKLLHEGVHCSIVMTNGKFISLSEECSSLRAKLKAAGVEVK
jgi:hypothetical protein